MLALVLAACGGPRGKGGVKDPGPAAEDPGTAAPTFADAGPGTAPAAEAPRLENEAIKSKFHPAHLDRDYPLKRADEIATTPEDKELMDLLGEPMKGEKAFNRIKKAGTAKYALLQASLELARRHYAELMEAGPPLANPRATRDYLRARLRDRDHEVFCCLFLDNRHRVIAFDEVFRGTIDGASVHPRGRARP
jgi:hypothetical protein